MGAVAIKAVGVNVSFVVASGVPMLPNVSDGWRLTDDIGALAANIQKKLAKGNISAGDDKQKDSKDRVSVVIRIFGVYTYLTQLKMNF